ncbi:histidine phosphatase family protein [Cytobacillus sp. Sa5YUA1]|uniref:Histidine phosphatase family protein n=1 Tax=Cytobacillus stercorigallinarum TaxID=2762240 RepID=A0ABR8QTQ0_9BACI|nr:histidine phosphatase family protein [Cytobacillus stercorigallinarum]MBD7938911.1 histidine phosphatase family protein [Cytobacillus stercorigallinarum]
MKEIYIVRHCQATGQSPDAELTITGQQQAEELKVFFHDRQIDRILSSPFLRAKQTIEPLAEKIGITVEVDERLSERVLSTTSLEDWQDKLKATFDDPDLYFPGGESSRQAMDRISQVIEEIRSSEAEHAIIVAHGNIISLLLKKYQVSFGFDEWQALTNPDVYRLRETPDGFSVERIWVR